MAMRTESPAPGSPPGSQFLFEPALFGKLTAQFAAVPAAQLEQRWLYLEAAHVVGQTGVAPHFRVHWLMLALAWETGDWREVAGQAFRMALVPLGHLTGRLPLGNSGKANVSAFEPMPVSKAVSEVIFLARKSMPSA